MSPHWHGSVYHRRRNPKATQTVKYPKRAVTGTVDRPIGKSPEGDDQALRFDVLECGHDLPARRAWGAFDVYVPTPTYRHCTKCPKESA